MIGARERDTGGSEIVDLDAVARSRQRQDSDTTEAREVRGGDVLRGTRDLERVASAALQAAGVVAQVGRGDEIRSRVSHQRDAGGIQAVEGQRVAATRQRQDSDASEAAEARCADVLRGTRDLERVASAALQAAGVVAQVGRGEGVAASAEDRGDTSRVQAVEGEGVRARKRQYRPAAEEHRIVENTLPARSNSGRVRIGELEVGHLVTKGIQNTDIVVDDRAGTAAHQGAQGQGVAVVCGTSRICIPMECKDVRALGEALDEDAVTARL